MSVKTIPLSSTAIKQIAYDSKDRSLVITFANGGTETKADVSQDQFEAFAAAPSAGKFYHANFKG